MATSEGIPSSIDIEFLELNDNPYVRINRVLLSYSQNKLVSEDLYILTVAGVAKKIWLSNADKQGISYF